MTGTVKPFCEGKGCSLKKQCCRYKENIDRKKEQHFPYSPFNGSINKCSFFVGDTIDTFLEQIKKMKGDGSDRTL